MIRIRSSVKRIIVQPAGQAVVCLLGIFGLLVVIQLLLIHSGARGDSAAAIIESTQTAVTAPAQLPQPEPKRELSFIAVGDVMLSRVVGDKMRKNGFDYPYAKMSEYLHSADFVFGNLETSITDGPRIVTGMMTFRADPGAEDALRQANFQVVSLANNHTPNFGQSGLTDTFSYLKKAGIAYAGAGANTIEARQPAIIEHGGIRLAFLAYNDTDVVPSSYGAAPNRAGTALMDIDELKKDVAAVKPSVDFVIVSMHSGTEYVPRPNIHQTAFAHAAIDAGAELVIGHHPHVVQTIETYKNKLIMYSLGNFVFDQMWSEETRQGLAALIDIDTDGVRQARFAPLMIEDYAQPRPASPAEAPVILRRLDIARSAAGIERWDRVTD